MCVVMSWKNLLLEVLEGDGKMPDDNNGGYMDLNNIEEGAEVEDIEDENLQFELLPPAPTPPATQTAAAGKSPEKKKQKQKTTFIWMDDLVQFIIRNEHNSPSPLYPARIKSRSFD